MSRPVDPWPIRCPACEGVEYSYHNFDPEMCSLAVALDDCVCSCHKMGIQCNACDCFGHIADDRIEIEDDCLCESADKRYRGCPVHWVVNDGVIADGG